MRETTEVVIRCDANPVIGLGHMSRCVELGRAFHQAGAAVSYVIARGSQDHFRAFPGATVHLIEDFPKERDDAAGCLSVVGPKTLFIVDHYGLGRRFDEIVSPAVRLYVNVVDDPDRHYIGHAIVNQNMGSESYVYQREPRTRLLAGSNYAILRDEFIGAEEFVVRDPARRILVMLGAAADLDASLTLLRDTWGAASARGLLVDVVVSGACERAGEISEASGKYEGVTLHHDVKELSRLMKRVDLCVTYCGSVVWELAALGVPAVLYCSVPNHVRRAEDLDRAGLAVNLGWLWELDARRVREAIGALIGDPARRLEMSQRSRALIDGQGKHRIVRELGDLAPRQAGALEGATVRP